MADHYKLVLALLDTRSDGLKRITYFVNYSRKSYIIIFLYNCMVLVNLLTINNEIKMEYIDVNIGVFHENIN